MNQDLVASLKDQSDRGVDISSAALLRSMIYFPHSFVRSARAIPDHTVSSCATTCTRVVVDSRKQDADCQS